MKLIIAEKPSVAKDYASAVGAKVKKNGWFEGNDFRVTWCYGHLVSLSYPEAYDEKYKKWSLDHLPIIPDNIMTEVNESTKDQYNIVKGLMNDSETTLIINGTDAGREGELIFRLVYRQSKCNKPFKRLWVSSLTEEAILEGMKNLQDGAKYNNLYDSALSRSESDWIVGLNGTRLYTCKYNTKLSVGRVQTPVLAMIVERDKAIRSFKSVPFYELEANIEPGFKAYWINADTVRRIDSLAEANVLLSKLSNKATVVNVEKKDGKKNPPLLYDLTLLQSEASKIYKISAKETLAAAQGLYEKHKLTTYPRTDSNYLSEDMTSTFPTTLKSLQKYGDEDIIQSILSSSYSTNGFVNNAKVTDHHAIIPTGKYVDLSLLTNNEKNIFNLVLKRFIAVFLPPLRFSETIIHLNISNERFISKGKVIRDPGWTVIDSNSAEVEEATSLLPALEIGETKKVIEVNKIIKKTSPPKQFDDGTLVLAMENCNRNVDDDSLKQALKERGLGTVATRADIIEKLILAGYIERAKSNLIPTEKGTQLIEIVDDKLKSVEMTGEWELQLNKIANGMANRNSFMNAIKAFTVNLIQEVSNQNKTTDFKQVTKSLEKEIIGSCPRCGKNVYESDKAFSCEGFKDDPKCSFSVWKENKWFETRSKKLTKTMMKQMLKSGKTNIQKFKKKDGGEYQGSIILKDDGKYINFEIEFTSNR